MKNEKNIVVENAEKLKNQLFELEETVCILEKEGIKLSLISERDKKIYDFRDITYSLTKDILSFS